MKKLIITFALLLPFMAFARSNQERVTGIFHVEIHCDACVKKIQNNIPYEKGLKDMRIDQKAETVTLTWDPQKTDTTTIKAAFEKIKKPVRMIEIKEQKK